MSCQATPDDGTNMPPPLHTSASQDAGFLRFVVVMINVFHRVHVRMPPEGQQGIQLLDDIFVVFEASQLDDTTIETLIGILTLPGPQRDAVGSSSLTLRCQAPGVLGCINERHKDPATQVERPGRLLPLPSVQVHEQQEVIHQAKKKQNNIDATFFAATFAEKLTDEDTFITGRSQHDGNAQPLEPALTNDGGTSKSEGLEVSSHVSGISTSHSASMNTLESLRELLHTHIHRLPSPIIINFVEKPSSNSSSTPGPLDPSVSSRFLKHQLAIDNLLEMVDAIVCDGDDLVQATRKALVQEIQDHQAYLDRVVCENRLRQKTSNTVLSTEFRRQLPIVHDNSHHFDIPAPLQSLAVSLLSCVFIGVLLHVLGSLSRQNASFLLIVMGRIVTSSL
ncbi:uncharacterized protein HD556DRAFT_1304750 [Suillus plorans]|uniref:BAG domain-containing protein n=1 Tax=Suillus plorans TaxID=116603 RepID=A0A9P7DQN3_9AGAM|nr:uncharacterized protein HD556DRAFT_1304750 [Suillus plorans]KAG1800732.1 hypothetical protein HD556DRAFT_1304750 [Suillus plorans]